MICRDSQGLIFRIPFIHIINESKERGKIMFDVISFVLMLLSTINLHVGNTWTYIVEPSHTIRIIEIAGEKKIGDKSFYVIKDSTLKDSFLVRKASGYLEIRESGEADKPGQEFPLLKEEPIPFFFFPDFIIETKNIHHGSVTTPANSFEDCLVFNLFLRRPNAPSDLEPSAAGSIWYKKGIGIVKMAGSFFAKENISLILTSYHVKKATLAILDLEEVEVAAGLGRTIAETLRSIWIKRDEYRIVERAMIQKVIEEHGLNMTGLIDSNTAVKVGEMLGTEKVLVGTISRVRNEYVMNLRLIDVKTGLASNAQTMTANNEKELLEKVITNK